MSVEPLLAHSARRPQATTLIEGRTSRRSTAPLCMVAAELRPGDGTTLARQLGRLHAQRVVVLTRQAERREVVQLLAAGLRGAVALSVHSTPRRTPGTGTAAGRVSQNSSVDRSVLTSGVSIAAPPRVDSEHPPLTAGELRVLRLVAAGCSNRKIGEDLELSVESVKSHLARMARKVGTGDRAGLVAAAIRTGQLLP